MNILLLGSGGREHAIAWKLKQSPLCNKLFIAPGNAGTCGFGENVPIGVNDFQMQKDFCLHNQIEMIVVGPEDPLVNGVYDFFKDQEDWKGIVVGPSKFAAQLEGSKAFSKKFMQRHAIPTAGYAEFNEANFEEGKNYIRQHSLPIVLKADGLAAGKGVVIAQSHEDALQVFEEMILHKQFGEASSKVVIEEFLDGVEVSVFVLTDGQEYKILGHAKDYKRIGEGDTGLNTGGMGCVTPVPFLNDNFMQKIETKIIQPTINGLAKENIIYKGFVFFGLINVKGEPMVIEYNCRMGDPETEVVIPRLKNDLVELFVAMDTGNLSQQKIETEARACATVVAVSGGYPGDYQKGKVITFPQNIPEGSIIFHAGTKEQNGNVLTNGGRVLAITSFGDNIIDAAKQSKSLLKEISFEGMNFRKDIGYEFE
ncbi:phosphoribosylamine--glycine ligase [Arachidicoccus sp.]|uniref:phosphoribosylamine--glycine ligase n=1 Tax=Arachidicoccus sp. TaxID=1872624 RepID=UPI003D1FD9FD